MSEYFQNLCVLSHVWCFVFFFAVQEGLPTVFCNRGLPAVSFASFCILRHLCVSPHVYSSSCHIDPRPLIFIEVVTHTGFGSGSGIQKRRIGFQLHLFVCHSASFMPRKCSASTSIHTLIKCKCRTCASSFQLHAETKSDGAALYDTPEHCRHPQLYF